MCPVAPSKLLDLFEPCISGSKLFIAVPKEASVCVTGNRFFLRKTGFSCRNRFSERKTSFSWLCVTWFNQFRIRLLVIRYEYYICTRQRTPSQNPAASVLRTLLGSWCLFSSLVGQAGSQKAAGASQNPLLRTLCPFDKKPLQPSRRTGPHIRCLWSLATNPGPGAGDPRLQYGRVKFHSRQHLRIKFHPLQQLLVLMQKIDRGERRKS